MRPFLHRLNSVSIGLKLPLVTVAIAAVTMLLIEVSAGVHLRSALVDAGEARLDAIVSTAAARTEAELDAIRQAAEEIAARAGTHRALVALSDGLSGERAAQGPVGETARSYGIDPSSWADAAYTTAYRRYHPLFLSFAVGLATDVLLVDGGGRIVYAMAGGRELTRDITDDLVSGSGLAAVAGRVLRGDGFSQDAVSDFEPYPPDAGRRSMFFGVPVRDDAGRVAGALVVRLSETQAVGILERVGSTLDWVSLSIHRSDGMELVRARSTFADPRPALSDDARLERQTEIAFRDLTFLVRARKPVAVVLSPLEAFRRELIIDGVQVLAAVSFLGVLFARSLTRPLVGVGAAMDDVARRHYETAIPGLERSDEIGRIARRLDSFRASLVDAERLARENAFTGAAFKDASAALALVDRGMTIIYVNRAFMGLVRDHLVSFGRFVPDITPDTLIGRSLVAFDHGVEAEVRRMTEAGRASISREVGFGRARFRVDIAPVHDADGAVIGYVAEFRDVSRVRLEAGVRAALETSYAMAEVAPDGRLISANAHFRALAGSADDSVTGHDWQMLFDWSGSDFGADDPIGDLREIDRIEGRLHPRGSSRAPIRAAWSAIRDATGRLEGAVLLADRPRPERGAGAETSEFA